MLSQERDIQFLMMTLSRVATELGGYIRNSNNRKEGFADFSVAIGDRGAPLLELDIALPIGDPNLPTHFYEWLSISLPRYPIYMTRKFTNEHVPDIAQGLSGTNSVIKSSKVRQAVGVGVISMATIFGSLGLFRYLNSPSAEDAKLNLALASIDAKLTPNRYFTMLEEARRCVKRDDQTGAAKLFKELGMCYRAIDFALAGGVHGRIYSDFVLSSKKAPEPPLEVAQFISQFESLASDMYLIYWNADKNSVVYKDTLHGFLNFSYCGHSIGSFAQDKRTPGELSPLLLEVEGPQRFMVIPRPDPDLKYYLSTNNYNDALASFVVEHQLYLPERK